MGLWGPAKKCVNGSGAAGTLVSKRYVCRTHRLPLCPLSLARMARMICMIRMVGGTQDKRDRDSAGQKVELGASTAASASALLKTGL